MKSSSGRHSRKKKIRERSRKLAFFKIPSFTSKLSIHREVAARGSRFGKKLEEIATTI